MIIPPHLETGERGEGAIAAEGEGDAAVDGLHLIVIGGAWEEAGDGGFGEGAIGAVHGVGRGRHGGSVGVGEAVVEGDIHRLAVRIDGAEEIGFRGAQRDGRVRGGGREEGHGDDGQAVLTGGSAEKTLPAVAGIEGGGVDRQLEGLDVDAGDVVPETSLIAETPCQERAIGLQSEIVLISGGDGGEILVAEPCVPDDDGGAAD